MHSTLFYIGCSCMFMVLGQTFCQESSSHNRRYLDYTIPQQSSLRNEFITSLKGVLRNLPEDNFCRILGKFLREKEYITASSYRVFMKLYPFKKSREKLCKEVRVKYKKNTLSNASDHLDVNLLMTRLYNRLPLPFQCNILTATTLNLAGRQSQTDSIKHNTLANFQILLSDDQSFSKTQRRRKISKLLEETEKKLNRLSRTVPVSKQCGKLIRQRSAYSNAMKIVVYGISENNIENTKRLLARKITTIVERYAIEQGIDVSIHPDIYHTTNARFRLSYVKTQLESDKLILYAIVHLIKSGRAPENANFVLNSLYDYGKEKLERELNIKLKITAVMNRSKMSLKKRYVGKEYMFPEHLVRYYRNLEPVQQCFIVKLLGVYSNKSSESVIKSLSLNQHVNNTKCLVHSNQVRLQPKILYSTIIPISTNLPIKVENIESEKEMTPVEILMIVALACVIVCSAIFCAVCCMFFYRKRKYGERKSEYLTPYDINDSDLHEYYRQHSNLKESSQKHVARKKRSLFEDTHHRNSENTNSTILIINEESKKESQETDSLVSACEQLQHEKIDGPEPEINNSLNETLLIMDNEGNYIPGTKLINECDNGTRNMQDVAMLPVLPEMINSDELRETLL